MRAEVSGLIEPIGPQQQQLVVAETERFVRLGEEGLGRQFGVVPVRFDLRGTAAGMFKAHGERRWIRYNPWIFAKFFEENLRATVPHEVAHYLVHEIYGARRVKPHGREWRALMEHFGADPEVTFKLDLEGIPRRSQSTHPYRCACREHQLSSTRHNRVQGGRGAYRCRYCDGDLVYAGA